MNATSIKFFLHAFFIKIASLVSVFLLAESQKKFSSNVELADISFLMQWISLVSIFDFGIINWINYCKTKNTVGKIYSLSCVYSGVLFSIIFSIFFIYSIKSQISLYIFILLNLYLFSCYLIYCSSFYFLKNEKYINSLILQFFLVIPQSIYFTCSYLSIFKIDLSEFIIFEILLKSIVIFYIVKKHHFFFIFKKYLKLLTKSLRFVYIQLCSFFQFGIDIFLFYYFFNTTDYNLISSSYRYLQIPLAFSGIMSSYLINFSASLRYKILSKKIMLSFFFIQVIFFYCISFLFNNETKIWMFLFIISHSLLTYLNTKFSIDKPDFFLRYLLISTPLILVFKILFLWIFKFEGIFYVVIIQILFFLIINNIFKKKIRAY